MKPTEAYGDLLKGESRVVSILGKPTPVPRIDGAKADAMRAHIDAAFEGAAPDDQAALVREALLELTLMMADDTDAPSPKHFEDAMRRAFPQTVRIALPDLMRLLAARSAQAPSTAEPKPSER